MKCPTIKGITLDRESRLAIKRIQSKLELLKLQQTAMGYGSIMTMFLGNSMPVASFNVSSFDFQALTRAVNVMQEQQRVTIEQEAAGMWHKSASNPKLSLFWKAIYNGCKAN